MGILAKYFSGCYSLPYTYTIYLSEYKIMLQMKQKYV